MFEFVESAETCGEEYIQETAWELIQDLEDMLKAESESQDHFPWFDTP